MGKYFDLLKKLVDDGIEGRNSGIPMGFFRLNNNISLQRGLYYLIGGYAGSGKCLAKGTQVLMYDGTYQKVEDIKKGDLLMGADSIPTKVKSTCSGTEEMYKITQNKGITYTVNASHVLSLKPSGKLALKYGKVLNISIIDFLKLPNYVRDRLYGYKTGVDFSEKPLPIDPYLIGIWLGDGSTAKPQITTTDPEVSQYLLQWTNENQHKLIQSGITYAIVQERGREVEMITKEGTVLQTFKTLSQASILVDRNVTNISEACRKKIRSGGSFWRHKESNSNNLMRSLKKLDIFKNKHIPFEYLRNSRSNRLLLLAGLIDSDGHYTNKVGFEIVQKREQLAKDIVWLAQSLGFYSSINKKKATMKRKDGSMYSCTVYRVGIYGAVDKIPTKIKRKQAGINTPNKDNLRTRIQVTALGEGEYYGFELEGNKLFLLEDFTVTHNTALLDDAFVLNPLDYILSHPKEALPALDIIYFSMERPLVYKLAKWVSRKIFLDEGILIPIKKMAGWIEKPKRMTYEGDLYRIFLRYEDYVEALMERIILIGSAQNPTGARKFVEEKYAPQHGTLDSTDKYNPKYTPNDPSKITLIISDHIGLTKGEKDFPKGKPAIDKASEDKQRWRDLYGFSPVDISQFNRDISNPTRLKNGDVEPMLEDFKETGTTQENADVVISLFNPMRYKVKDFIGYNLDKLTDVEGRFKYRNLKILKNSFGTDDVRIGMAFQPEIGLFKEMPKLEETHPSTYTSIIDNTYFLNRR